MSSDLMSERRKNILRFISGYLAEYGYSPSLREVAHAMELKSPSSILTHLRVLEEGGVITRTPGQPRTLRLLVVPDLQINRTEKGEMHA